MTFFVTKLNRHSPTYDNILTLAAYGYTIFTTGEYSKDPDTDHTASGAVPWCIRVIGGVKLFMRGPMENKPRDVKKNLTFIDAGSDGFYVFKHRRICLDKILSSVELG